MANEKPVKKPVKKPAPPVQMGLFGTALPCPDIENLPLIVDPQGAIEVLAPGSIYQPLLLSPQQDTIDVGPGTLDAHEEAFVRDLIRFLYPAGNHPKSARTPLTWGSRDLWLKRNIEKQPDSFRLRVDDSDWFYPDFIVWIMDHETRTQTFGFVDPKGLTLGAGGGWSDYKIVSTLYQPHVVERQLTANGQRVEFAGQPWTFRVRGVLVSTSAYPTLTAQAKFHLNDEDGRLVAPTEADFRRGRIVFQRPNPSYIADCLRLLTEDSDLDRLLALTAHLFDDPGYFVPMGEEGHDLALRHLDHAATDSEFVAALLRDYLRPDAHGHYGAWARKRRQRDLMDYAREAILGFGAEKAVDIRDHPTPCTELWRRRQKTA